MSSDGPTVVWREMFLSYINYLLTYK